MKIDKVTGKQKKAIAAAVQKARPDGDGKTPHTAQQTIRFKQMYRDGICKVTDRLYTKTIQFFDINYQLAQNEDKTAIFENYCDFLNYFDSTIKVQLSFLNQVGDTEEFMKQLEIQSQDDDFDDIRREYTEMLKNQLSKGNNGLVKTKYITFGVEEKSLKDAKQKLERIETDILTNFKTMGVLAQPLTGAERLAILHRCFNPDSREKFHFSWDLPAQTGNSVKDFIAPSSFDFSKGNTFRMSGKYGAVSFINIMASEMSDRMLADFLNIEHNITLSIHICSVDQNKAIKMIKRKITDLDKMKMEEQKKAFRNGYDIDIIRFLMKVPPFVIKWLIAAVHIVIDLGSIKVADSCRSIVEHSGQICLDIPDLCCITFKAPKDVLDMLAVDFQETASNSLRRHILLTNSDLIP